MKKEFSSAFHDIMKAVAAEKSREQAALAQAKQAASEEVARLANPTCAREWAAAYRAKAEDIRLNGTPADRANLPFLLEEFFARAMASRQSLTE